MRSRSMPTPLVEFACGSASTSNVFRSAVASDAARLTAVVVLPTPPFWLAIAITRGILQVIVYLAYIAGVLRGANIRTGTPAVKSEFHVKRRAEVSRETQLAWGSCSWTGAPYATRRRQRAVSITRLCRSLGDTPGMRAA